MKNKKEDKVDTTGRVCPYLNKVAFIPDMFTPEDCDRIIEEATETWIISDGGVSNEESNDGYALDQTYRTATVYTPPKEIDWLFGKTFASVLGVNNKRNGYQFNITALAEFPCVMKYEAADINKTGTDGHYDWHMDIGPSYVASIRKLSYSVLLNPEDYVGGEICFHIGRNFEDPFPGQDAKGGMVIFPSYIAHKVLPVTRGVRYALVGWVHGSSFS